MSCAIAAVRLPWVIIPETWAWAIAVLLTLELLDKPE